MIIECQNNIIELIRDKLTIQNNNKNVLKW